MEDRNEMAQSPSTVDRQRGEFDSLPISAAITSRGKELAKDDSVGMARQFFARHPVQALPVLDGATYVGAVTQDAIGADVPDGSPVLPFASNTLPTVVCDAPAPAALAVLDRDGGKRLVVLGADDLTYVGLVCMRGDRQRLCVAVEPIDRQAFEPGAGVELRTMHLRPGVIASP